MPKQFAVDDPPFVTPASSVIVAGHGVRFDAWAIDYYKRKGIEAAKESGPGADPAQLTQTRLTTLVPPQMTVTVWAELEIVRGRRGVIEESRWDRHTLDEPVGKLIDSGYFTEARNLLHKNAGFGHLPLTFSAGEEVPNMLLQFLSRPGGHPRSPALHLYRVPQQQAITLRRILQFLAPPALGPIRHVHWSACAEPIYSSRTSNPPRRGFTSNSALGSGDLCLIYVRADDDIGQVDVALQRVTSPQPRVLESMERRLKLAPSDTQP